MENVSSWWVRLSKALSHTCLAHSIGEQIIKTTIKKIFTVKSKKVRRISLSPKQIFVHAPMPTLLLAGSFHSRQLFITWLTWYSCSPKTRLLRCSKCLKQCEEWMFYIPPKCFFHLALTLSMTGPEVLWLLRMGWWRIVQSGESQHCCSLMFSLFQCDPWCESSPDELRVLWRKLVWTTQTRPGGEGTTEHYTQPGVKHSGLILFILPLHTSLSFHC